MTAPTPTLQKGDRVTITGPPRSRWIEEEGVILAFATATTGERLAVVQTCGWQPLIPVVHLQRISGTEQ